MYVQASEGVDALPFIKLFELIRPLVQAKVWNERRLTKRGRREDRREYGYFQISLRIVVKYKCLPAMTQDSRSREARKGSIFT